MDGVLSFKFNYENAIQSNLTEGAAHKKDIKDKTLLHQILLCQRIPGLIPVLTCLYNTG